MKLRPLTLNALQEAKARKVVEYAEDPKHYYYPERRKGGCPGDLPDFNVMLDTYSCVYSHTVIQDKHYRHLSIRVSGTGYANPLAAFNIAALFGFKDGVTDKNGFVTAPGKDWGVDIHDGERTFVITQEIKEKECATTPGPQS